MVARVKVRPHGRKKPIKITIKGRYIHERYKSPKAFDPESIRTRKVGKHRVIVGCPKGKYHKHDENCTVGMQTQAVLHPKKELGKKYRRVKGGKVRRIKSA